MRIKGVTDMPTFDDHSQFADKILFPVPKIRTHRFAVMDWNDDSLGGFRKLCK
jgi:hypothetical protein